VWWDEDGTIKLRRNRHGDGNDEHQEAWREAATRS
jgi:hypothetical protein